MNDFIPLSEVQEYKVGKFLYWPEYNNEIVMQRIEQLDFLGVKSIAVGGPHNIQGIHVLGKGHSGIVVRAMWKGKEVALKARRSDADRKSMEREAGFLAHVNQWGLGPEFYGFTKDFIVMEKIVGLYLGDWVKANVHNKDSVRRIIKGTLDIAWRLDQSGLDHGELTRIKRHYIVTENGPRVIDFESASFDRTPRNLTSTVQSIFMNFRYKQLLEEVIQLPDSESLLLSLRRYKKEPSKANFQFLVKICNLEI